MNAPEFDPAMARAIREDTNRREIERHAATYTPPPAVIEAVKRSILFEVGDHMPDGRVIHRLSDSFRYDLSLTKRNVWVHTRQPDGTVRPPWPYSTPNP